MPVAFVGKLSGLLASGGSAWPGLRRLNKDAVGGLAVAVAAGLDISLRGCLLGDWMLLSPGRFDMVLVELAPAWTSSRETQLAAGSFGSCAFPPRTRPPKRTSDASPPTQVHHLQ